MEVISPLDVDALSVRHALTDRATRTLNTAAAILATSVLTDSLAEHYRAGFHNRAMFIAPVVAAAVVATATGRALRPHSRGRARMAILGTATLTGLVGFGFHLANDTSGQKTTPRT
jgi:hypothetical protein